MNKKEYVLKVLELLAQTWMPAQGLLYLIKRDEFDDDMINTLTIVLQNAVKKVKQDHTMNKLKNSLTALEKIKRLEGEHKEKEQEELDDMLQDI